MNPVSETQFRYSLRVSPRARHVRLKVTPLRGLEIVVPVGYDRRWLPDLLDRKREWIRSALDRADAIRSFVAPAPAWEVPDRIELRAVGRTIRVHAQETDSPRVGVRPVGPDAIRVCGRIGDGSACRLALVGWMADRTREHLLPRLQALSASTGLGYRRVFIRQQRTRWASCSKRRNISLNLNLLFLPPDPVEYVLIHELCHLAELNHSKRFWDTVERFCPGYRTRDAQVREMWKMVPRWAVYHKSLETHPGAPGGADRGTGDSLSTRRAHWN